MKIALSATAPNLNAQIDPRFGRCRYFIIIDPETLQFEAIENTGAAASGGAGISTAQMVTGKSITAVLTGNCGPNAYQVLASAGIQVFTGVTGTVKDAVSSYTSGKLHTAAQPNVKAHAGMGLGIRDGGSNPGADATSEQHPQTQSKADIETLKAETKQLMEELKNTGSRINNLDKKTD